MDAIHTGSLVGLRHPKPQDESEYKALREVSRAALAPWEPIPDAGMDPASSAAFAQLLGSADSERHQKALVFRLSDQCIVGYIGINEIVRGAFQSAYLGYWIGAPYRRRGYGTEAVSLAISRALGELGLHRVEANIISTNVASLAIARRCGMRKEGYSLRYLAIAGKWQDHERWAITREELPLSSGQAHG
jgi:ribosomal-protein-alanine N-acetyltransferase